MTDKDCLFCKIGRGVEPAKVVFETEEFLCIENKYPVAPVHVLVIPKAHVSKKDWISHTSPRLRVAKQGGQTTLFWSKIMPVVFLVVAKLGLDRTGYKLVNNGAGYNHFDHEHIHILGGTSKEPGGTT